jgi:hypothetical protein
MKNIFFLALTAFLLLTACSSNKFLGSKVKEPFTGEKYESNNRYFRGVGKGESKDQNISESKCKLMQLSLVNVSELKRVILQQNKQILLVEH